MTIIKQAHLMNFVVKSSKQRANKLGKNYVNHCPNFLKIGRLHTNSTKATMKTDSIPKVGPEGHCRFQFIPKLTFMDSVTQHFVCQETKNKIIGWIIFHYYYSSQPYNFAPKFAKHLFTETYEILPHISFG